MAGNLEAERPIRLGMHTYTLHFFGFGESWGFGKDYFFDQVMSLYELMDKADEWGLDGLQYAEGRIQRHDADHGGV